MKASKIIKPKISIEGATSWTISTLAVENNRFYLGTFAHTLSIGDIKSKKYLEIQSKQEIESVVLYKDFVFAAGDGFIGMYDKISGEFLYEFVNAHMSCIHSIIIHKNLLISGSKEIKIWDLTSKDCLAILEGTEELVQSLIIKDNVLIAGYDGGAIILWDLTAKKIIRTLIEHSWSVTSLATTDTTIISGGGDGLIKIWDFNSGKCLNTLIGHEKWIESIAVYKNYLFSASEVILKIWDLASGNCLNTLKLDDEILHLTADSEFLYTISDGSLFHQWSLEELISHEPLEVIIPNDFYLKSCAI